MRYYRDLAVSLEKRRKCRRNSADSGVMISSHDGSCQRKANAAEVVTIEPWPTPDTSKDMVSADGSSSNEMMVSAEGSSGDSDNDNVFFEAKKISPPRERRNSYTIERNPNNERHEEAEASELQNSPPETVLVTASESSSTSGVLERRNSFTVNKSPSTASESSKIPVQCERRNSYTVKDSPSVSENRDLPVPGECQNSYTVQDPHISASESSTVPVARERQNSYTIDPISAAVASPTVPVVKERRNSYTLESPSPIMLQYMQSLEHHNPSKQCELFVESLQYNVPDVLSDENQLENGIDEKELSLEDLVSDSTESDDLKLSELGMWDACSDETLHNFLNADLQAVESLPSSICGSPVSVIPACNLSECLKNSSEQAFDAKPTLPVINRSCDCICNAVSNLEPLRSEVVDAITARKNHLDDSVDDSFSRDFRYLDLSNFSYDSDYLEGRYSECSSVSLSKFLSGDKLPDGAEAEYVAFSYMKEQLEQKHRNEFKRLLSEQQREHENLKAQFTKVSSLSKHTPSPKSNYAYSGSVLLKKYTPTSGQSTPLRPKSADERQTNGTCNKSNRSDALSNVVEVKKKTLVENGKLPRPAPTVEQAASKINAAIRGYLTRRLFKTERVTNLVQTIKDCLATAVSLQNEPNLGLSELDLQSRLLQQVCNFIKASFPSSSIWFRIVFSEVPSSKCMTSGGNALKNQL